MMAKEKKRADEMEMEMMVAHWKLHTHGASHRMLAGMAGSWNARIKIWSEPDKPSTESSGWSEQKMILDGRFLHQEFNGEMMGSPFIGIGITGYDNGSKQYVSNWMDSSEKGKNKRWWKSSTTESGEALERTWSKTFNTSIYQNGSKFICDGKGIRRKQNE